MSLASTYLTGRTMNLKLSHPNTMKRFVTLLLPCLLLLSVLPTQTKAQKSDREAVFAALEGFFEGFAEQDSTKMFTYMEKGGRLVLTSNDPNGNPTMREFGAEEFVGMLMQPRPQPIKETISNPEIRIVDNLAAVWIDYNLWVGDQIDHCGVDHFQLFRSPTGWKIIATADTQKQSGCAPFE